MTGVDGLVLLRHSKMRDTQGHTRPAHADRLKRTHNPLVADAEPGSDLRIACRRLACAVVGEKRCEPRRPAFGGIRLAPTGNEPAWWGTGNLAYSISSYSGVPGRKPWLQTRQVADAQSPWSGARVSVDVITL